MKRLMMKAVICGTIAVSTLGLVGTPVQARTAARAQTQVAEQTADQAQQRGGRRVYCQATHHRVTCYNYTQYRVYMHVRIYTVNGTIHWYPTNRRTRISRFVGPYINSIRWTWHF